MSGRTGHLIVELDGHVTAFEISPELVAAVVKIAKVERSRKMERRILDDFTITEISAVDRPAQAGAKMAIMKAHPWSGATRSTPAFDKRRSTSTFADAVNAIAKNGEGRLSRMRAMRKARLDRPDLYDEYQAEGAALEKAAYASAPAAVGTAGDHSDRGYRDFQAVVDKVQQRDGTPRSVAMSTARKEYPQHFAAMQQIK